MWHPLATFVASVFFFVRLFLPPGAVAFGPFILSKADVDRLLPLALVLIFDPRLLAVLWHWIDIPVFVFCLRPFISGVANQLSWQVSSWEGVREFEYWFVPYLLGRSWQLGQDKLDSNKRRILVVTNERANGLDLVNFST